MTLKLKILLHIENKKERWKTKFAKNQECEKYEGKKLVYT